MINCFAGDAPAKAEAGGEAPADEKAEEIAHWTAEEAGAMEEPPNNEGKIHDKEIYIFTNMT